MSFKYHYLLHYFEDVKHRFFSLWSSHLSCCMKIHCFGKSVLVTRPLFYLQYIKIIVIVKKKNPKQTYPNDSIHLHGFLLWRWTEKSIFWEIFFRSIPPHPLPLVKHSPLFRMDWITLQKCYFLSQYTLDLNGSLIFIENYRNAVVEIEICGCSSLEESSKDHLLQVPDLSQGQTLSKSFLTSNWLSHSQNPQRGQKEISCSQKQRAGVIPLAGWRVFSPDVQPKEHSLNQIIACWKANRIPGTVTLLIMQMERNLTEHPLSWAVSWIFRVTPWFHYRTIHGGLGKKKKKKRVHTFIYMKCPDIYFSYILSNTVVNRSMKT